MWPLIVFLILNFAALAIGSGWAGNPGTNTWYQALAKAPWTPPGWAFGAAWSLIMIAFAVFMAKAWEQGELRLLLPLFAAQWALNVLWNPIFFRWHLVLPGLVVITALLVLVSGFAVWGYRHLDGGWWLLTLPYVIWLALAASLNGFIWLKN